MLSGDEREVNQDGSMGSAALTHCAEDWIYLLALNPAKHAQVSLMRANAVDAGGVDPRGCRPHRAMGSSEPTNSRKLAQY